MNTTPFGIIHLSDLSVLSDQFPHPSLGSWQSLRAMEIRILFGRKPLWGEETAKEGRKARDPWKSWFLPDQGAKLKAGCPVPEKAWQVTSATSSLLSWSPEPRDMCKARLGFSIKINPGLSSPSILMTIDDLL